MSFLGKINDQYAELWKAVIRPPRDVYETRDLGPTLFSIEQRTYRRTDLSLKNPRGLTLVCSHFEPVPSERVAEKLPCVVYLHGNCSSRLEAVSTLPVLLPFNISVFCLDFAGSGLSDGEYLSLGYYEKDDLATAIDYLRESNTVTCIGLWGRSMGASTALLHADRDPSIAGLVLDSPFSDLKVLCEELVDIYTKSRVPNWVVSVALSMVRHSISQHAIFDIYDLVPIDHVSKSFIPALFAAAYNDNFIRPYHAKELYDAYGGDKNFVMVEGDHNSARSKFFMDSVAMFFFNTLQCDQLSYQQSLRRWSWNRGVASTPVVAAQAGGYPSASASSASTAGVSSGAVFGSGFGAVISSAAEAAVARGAISQAAAQHPGGPGGGGGSGAIGGLLGLQMRPPDRGVGMRGADTSDVDKEAVAV